MDAKARDETEAVDWYPSTVDAWLGVLIVSVPVIVVAALAMAIIEGEGVWLAVLTCLFVAALYAGLVVPVRYGLGRHELVVRFGIVRQRVPYRDIRSVRPTRNPLSSPALSINRLRVDHGGGFMRTVMISPVRREAFLDSLARRTGLRREGESLLPVDRLDV